MELVPGRSGRATSRNRRCQARSAGRQSGPGRSESITKSWFLNRTLPTPQDTEWDSRYMNLPGSARARLSFCSLGWSITIEPGAYVPGLGGVRIEDMVLVTETATRFLRPLERANDPLRNG